MKSFIDKNFGQIVTFCAALATLVVSCAAIYVSYQQVKITNIESERKWQIEAANFISENYETLFGSDQYQRDRLKAVFVKVFPPQLVSELNTQLETLNRIENREILANFLKPDGININEENVIEVKDWIKENKKGLSLSAMNLADSDLITIVMINTNDSIIKKVVKDLDLNTRLITYKDREEYNVNKKQQELEAKGAKAFTELQPDGQYKINAILPSK